MKSQSLSLRFPFYYVYIIPGSSDRSERPEIRAIWAEISTLIKFHNLRIFCFITLDQLKYLHRWGDSLYLFDDSVGSMLARNYCE